MVKSKSKPDGLLKRIRGTKQHKDDPELQGLLQEVQSNPDNFRARRKLAEYYLKTGENAHAVEQFLIVAAAYASREFYGKGAAVYKQVLQLDPNNIDVHVKLAELYKQLGLVREVAENLQKAASLYQAQGKSREALNIQRKMLDLDPGNTIERIRLGQTLLEKGYITEAVSEFLRVADVFEQQGKQKELQKLLEGVLDRGLENFDILHRLTELYRAQGHPELALARLAKLSGDLAGSSSALELTAELAEELGKPVVAVKALERASELYRQSNRTDRVRALCRQILRMDEGNEYAAKWLDELGDGAPEMHTGEDLPLVESLRPTTTTTDDFLISDGPISKERMIEEVTIDSGPAYEAPESSMIDTPIAVMPITEISLDEEPPVIDRTPLPRKPIFDEPNIAEVSLDDEPPVVVEEPRAPEAVHEEKEPEPIAEIEPLEEEPRLPEIPERIDFSFIEDAEIEARMNEAVEPYFQADDLEKVFAYLNRAVEQNPEALPVLVKLADLYREAGDREKLIDILRRLASVSEKHQANEAFEGYLVELVDTAPDDIEARVKLADLYREDRIDKAIPLFFELADRYRELEQPAQSEAMLSRILSLDPLSKQAHESLADLYAGLNRRDEEIEELALLADIAAEDGAAGEAEEYWLRIIEYRPGDEKSIENLLRLYEANEQTEKVRKLLQQQADRHVQAGRLDDAIENLGRLAEIDQDNVAILQRLKDLFLQKGDEEKALEQLRQIADRSVSAEDYPVAIAALQEVLRLAPRDRMTREGLADLYLQTDNSAQAAEEIARLVEVDVEERDSEKALLHLERLLELDPTREAARLRRKDLLLELGRREEAVSMLYALADEWAKDHQFDKAENALQEILSGDPNAVHARLALKHLFLSGGQAGKAIAELVELAGQSEKTGDIRSALGYWGEISGLDPENLEARRGIARLHLAAGEIDSAVAEWLALAEWQLQHHQQDEAIDTLCEIHRHAADNEQATERLTELYFQTGRRDQAVELLYECGERAMAAERADRARDFFLRIVKAAPAHLATRERLKEVLLKMNRPAEAIEQLFALADLWAATGDDARVEEISREILRLDPKNIQAVLMLKDLLLKDNRIDQALDALFGVIVQRREAGDLEEAKNLTGEMLLIAEDERRALETMAELDLETGDAEGAADHYLRLAELCEAAGDVAAVEQYLRKIIALNNGHAAARQHYKELLLQRGQTAEAIEQMLALADLAADRNDSESARAYYQEILALEPDNESALEKYIELMVYDNQGLEATGEMHHLARLAEARADFPRAETYLQQLLELKPEDEPALELLARVYIASGDTGQAINELFKLEAAAGKTGDQAKALGIIDRILELDDELLSALQRKAELESLLQRTDQAVSTWIRLAEIQRVADLAPDAEHSLRQALKLAPDNRATHEKLCEILVALDKTPEAIEEILQFNRDVIEAKNHEQIIAVARRILELDSRSERARRMIIDAAKALRDQDTAIAEMFVLADFYGAEERREDLEEVLKEVLSLRETDPRATDRLVDIYLDEGRRDDALQLLIAVGDAYRRLEKFAEARGAYERVLELEDGHFASLEKLKDSYLAEDNITEAIEILFRTLTAADAQEDPAKAIAVLEEILVLDERHEEAMDELKNRYLKAGRTDQAVALLFTADRKMTGSWDAERLLANTEEILDLEPENQAALRRLADLLRETSSFERAVEVLFKLAELTRRDGAIADGERLLREILGLDPDRLRAYEGLLAIARERNERQAQAENLFAIARLKQAAGDLPGAEQALGEIQELEEFTLPALTAKEKLFADTGRKDRLLETRFEKAAYYAGRDQVAEAENSYRGIIAEFGENLLARESLILLYEHGNRPDEAADQAMILAERARKNGEYEEAVARYRQVLSFTKDNLAARRHLKDLFLETGHTEEAIEEWQALAAAARSRGDDAGVEEALEGILKWSPENREVRRELIDLFRHSNREIPAVRHLLLLAEQLLREPQVEEAIDRLKEALQLRPDDEAVNRLLKEAYLLAGNKPMAIETLFNMYNVEMMDRHRHNAERCLREILELDPQNANAKEKVFSLFTTDLSKEEKIADLQARVEEAMAAENIEGARLALKQILVLEPTHAEARNRLAELPAMPEEIALGLEEPLADDVFAVHHITENVDQAEEEIALDWDAAEVTGEGEALTEKIEEAPAVEAKEIDELEVFTELTEEPATLTTAETQAESISEQVPEEQLTPRGESMELSERELTIETPAEPPVLEMPEEKVEEKYQLAPEVEQVPAETVTLEPPAFSAESVVQEEAAEPIITAPVFEEASEPPAPEAPAVEAPAVETPAVEITLDPDRYEMKAREGIDAAAVEQAASPFEREDELTRAVDAFLNDVREEKTTDDQIPKISTVEDEYGTEDVGEVKVIDDLVTDPMSLFQQEQAAGKEFTSTETSADDFLKDVGSEELMEPTEPEKMTEPIKPEPRVVAPRPSVSHGRILEDFRPFTDSLPDETLTRKGAPQIREPKAPATDDLLAELIGGLETEKAAGEPAAEPETSTDLVGDVFGEAKQEPVGGNIFESFISSLGVKSDTARSAQEHYNFGIAYREMDENEKAIEEFEKAMLKNDEMLAFQINYQLGQCYAALEKHEMAAEYLEVALLKGTDDEQTMLDLAFDLALSLRLAGAFDEAREYFQQVDAKSKNYRNTKAQIKACKKKDRSAI